ncbi:MAG: NAD(P)/FAD-dependent oxidoreductase [Spirochaetaceae bacterium]|nr:NAD(P)/FAD-dependent oxidoreductase [Spirochaetaceae bacterium]
MPPDLDVAVVGGGHNGLTAAWYLARAGLRVGIFERRPFVGGAAITEELWPGYRFSTCAHMVHALDPGIQADLRLEERGMVAIPRTGAFVPIPGGDYWGPADHESPRNLSLQLTADETEAERRYADMKRRLCELFAPYRLRTPPTLAEARAAAAARGDGQILEDALTRTVRQLRHRYLPTGRLRDRHAAEAAAIGHDPGALALAYGSIDLAGPDARSTPHNGYIQGGIGVITSLMRQAVEEAGVRIHTSAEAVSLVHGGGAATGVRLADGTEVTARCVLSNLDPKRTFLRLVPPELTTAQLRRRVSALVTEVSCYKLLAAVDELLHWQAWDGDPALPSRGVVGLGRSEAVVDAAYADCDAGRPPAEPIVNFSVPSALDPTLAPDGRHTASAWIYPAPARLRDTGWDTVRDRVAERLVDQITRHAPNFRRSILHLRLRTPADLERENGLTDGCIWHIQHGGDQLFWNRPLPELSRYRAPFPGLYLCGAGQHPGGEISGIPGRNAAQEVIRDLA